jgi:hypothetical protein
MNPLLPGARNAIILLLIGAVVLGVVLGVSLLSGSRPLMIAVPPPSSRAIPASEPTPAAVLPSPVPARPTPRGEPIHPSIAVVRNRLLEEYHGNTTNVFTNVDGFGWERMGPTYEQIPFEIPYYSTEEIEVERAPAPPALLADVVGRSVADFENPTRSFVKKTPERKVPYSGDLVKGFGPVVRGTVAHGIQLRMIDLVGLTDPDNPHVYRGGQAFELVVKERLLPPGKTGVAVGPAPPTPAGRKQEPGPEGAPPETRAMDLFEIAGVEELRKGKDVYIRYSDRTIRMLGALRAGTTCLPCHTAADKGDLLGAFSYTLVDFNRNLFPETNEERARSFLRTRLPPVRPESKPQETNTPPPTRFRLWWPGPARVETTGDELPPPRPLLDPTPQPPDHFRR